MRPRQLSSRVPAAVSRRPNSLARLLATAALAVVVMGAIASPGPAGASLKPASGSGATFVGRGWYSADALGQSGTGGLVQAGVPSGSKVEMAFLYATYYFTSSPIPVAQRTINFDGTTVTLAELTHAAPGPCCSLRSARATVTGQVAAKVGTGGGITNFAVLSDPSGLDGIALVVIYSNPTLPDATIAVMDGGAEQAGDTTTFSFLTPINKSLPGFQARLSLGSGFSYQGPAGHVCGGFPQYSIVNVNTKRLTTCAGSYDDGAGANGALITVGGVGDSPNNPANPSACCQGEDDELYDLAPLLNTGDTTLEIKSANPSGDDILFLVVIAVTGRATLGCVENGLGLLDSTPAKGAASAVVHGTVEPIVDGVSPVLGDLVHTVNCGVVVPVEDTVDSLVAPPVAGPRFEPGALPGTAVAR